jgi:DNA gyrase/topoisomerase IV subunit A
MRKLLLALVGLGMVTMATAQSKVNKKDVQKATDELVALYQLNAQQTKDVYEIQEGRLINLAEIEKIKTTDHPLYLRKCRAVRIATENALKKQLTASQLNIYYTQVGERRKRELAKMKELKRQGADKEQIELGLLEIE